MGYHVFIIMPFGIKNGIHFDRVYANLIKPALEEAGLDVFRADEEIRPGNIRADMFQELLIADLVVADLSVNNPNAWYELGVRHGLRARGVIQIRSGVEKLPFDVCVDRTLRYHLKEGEPDPKYLEEDRYSLRTMALETLQTYHGRRISPVYQYLPYLQEPDWKSLRVQGADEFWHRHERWCQRIEIARKRKRTGDILVLADEAPTNAFRLEAYRVAGHALRSLGQWTFALEQFEKALAIDPQDIQSAQQKGILLGRLKKTHAAEEWLRALVKNPPAHTDTWALLGRVEKEHWIAAWKTDNATTQALRENACLEIPLLDEAIKAYRQGFIAQPQNYHAGINALTLTHLRSHLSADQHRDAELTAMAGGVLWAVTCELAGETPEKKNYWARVTLAELELLQSDNDRVRESYRAAVSAAEKDWFDLDSTRQQLELLQDLGFRPAAVKTALNVIDQALVKAGKLNEWKPRYVFLFSGHMIDAPERKDPRFPAAKEAIAASAIAEKLETLGAGPEDLGLCGGACGGDLLFAEACLARGMRIELRIPFEEPLFLEKSVAFAGDHWTERYYDLAHHPNTRLYIMPDELGLLPSKFNAYERDNLWQLYSALSWGADNVRFICLWNREGGDGPGGTRHMHDAVKRRSGRVFVLDTNKLFKENENK